MPLFYLDKSNNIMLANYTSTVGNSILSLVTTVQIITSADVHESSKLAAVFLDNHFGYRLYYQGTTGAL